MTDKSERHGVAVPLKPFLGYFLRLGAFGFGGPVVLTGHMQADLVDGRRWFTRDEFKEALAFSQLCPGPLAAQLAMYLGWVRAGWLGATLTGAVFILPSFFLTLAISALYVRYGALAWIQALFYSIGAAVIGIMAKSAYTLAQKTSGRDRLLWALLVFSAGYTVLTRRENVWIFVLSGFVALLVKAPPKLSRRSAIPVVVPAWLVMGIGGVASEGTLLDLLGFFSKAGAFVFGSGLAVVPFLYGGVVEQYHWLNERQFIDAVAVGMITPGPVVITSAFIGFLAAGLLGSLVASGGVFLPVYFFVTLLAPVYHRHAANAQVKAFVGGVTAAAVGGIVGAVYVLGRGAVVDATTAAIALVTCGVVLKLKKLPEAVVILVAGILGILLKGIS